MKAPDFLRDATARREWRRLWAKLEAEGRAETVDETALGMAVNAFAEYVAAAAEVLEEGSTVTTDKGNVLAHPLVCERDRAWNRAMKGYREIGLTPLGEVQVWQRLETQRKQQPDPAAAVRDLKVVGA
jgi:P27 family predicted phage terminase small subunit